ncbi:MAG: hypothetical protein ACI9F2_000075 [Lysobacterales bacterium]|jgi:hypothetical protein
MSHLKTAKELQQLSYVISKVYYKQCCIVGAYFVALVMFVDVCFWRNFDLLVAIGEQYSYKIFYAIDWSINITLAYALLLSLLMVFKIIHDSDLNGKPGTNKETYLYVKSHLNVVLITGFYALSKTFLWGLLFIVPGVFAGVRYNFSVIEVFLMNTTPREAIEKSKDIVNHHWWHCFRLVFSVIVVLLMVVYSHGSFAYSMNEALQLKNGTIWLYLIDFALVSLIWCVVVFLAAFYYELYKDMRSKIT